ncbi:MAG: thioredoxin family protein [Sandaracinus sp.]
MARALFVAFAISLAACGGGATSTRPAASAPRDEHHGPNGEIVGLTSRSEIEAELPAWRDAIAGASFDTDAAERLRAVPAGAEVEVILGTWCGDSRREISRLFRALEHAEAGGALPFTIRFVGVDRAKTAPGFTEGLQIRYVPTIVVRREGAEVGRIVESAPQGVDRALLGLLDGSISGTVTGRVHL